MNTKNATIKTGQVWRVKRSEINKTLKEIEKKSNLLDYQLDFIERALSSARVTVVSFTKDEIVLENSNNEYLESFVKPFPKKSFLDVFELDPTLN